MALNFQRAKHREIKSYRFTLTCLAKFLNKVKIVLALILLSAPPGEGFIDKIIIGEPDRLAKLDQKLTFLRYNILQIIAVIVIILQAFLFSSILLNERHKSFCTFLCYPVLG